MPDHKNKEKKTLNPPDNTELEFFAYGIFKPGQLAYSKIRNHVKEKNSIEINYQMKLRDGVPILIDNQRDYNKQKDTLSLLKKVRKDRLIKQSAIRY